MRPLPNDRSRLTARTYWWVRRLTPRVLAYLLQHRARRARVVVASVLASQPVLQGVAHSVLLTDQVSLCEVAGDARHGVSELVLESIPEAIHFPQSSFGRVIEASSRYLDGAPFGLSGYPRTASSSPLPGGMMAVSEPSPGFIYVPPQRYHCTLYAPYLNLWHGGLCTAATAMVRDCATRSRSGARLKNTWLYGSIKPRTAPLLSGDFASVWGNWAHANYYHWLIECLPRLARLDAIKGSPPISLLMPKSMPAVWEDSLACCLPDGMRVQRATGWVRPERFVFVSYAQIVAVGWLATSDREYLRSKTFARFCLDAGRKPTRRIFISRSRAVIRRLVNEDEVAQVLARFGFEMVHLEGLSFEQQVRLFHDAEFIAGAHGAGFANLLFAGRAKVLELFARGRFKPHYFFLARSLGLDHDFLLGGKGNRLEDFSIDVAELASTVERMLRRG